MLQVTQMIVTARAKNSPENLVAFIDLCFNESLYVRNIKLIKLSDRTTLSFPSRERKRCCDRCYKMVSVKHLFCFQCGFELPRWEPDIQNTKNDVYIDIVHPADSVFRGKLLDLIVRAVRGEKISDGGVEINVRKGD